MSWSSRFPSWTGRLSPFSRYTSPSSAQVTDNDFSYITSEDLARVRNSDILILKNRRVSYPLHLPAGSIDDGEVTIGVLRIAAAKKLDVKDPRRVKLFYKGRNLNDDKRLARDEGFRSDLESEILCAVGEANTIGVDGHHVEDPEAADEGVSDGDSNSDDDDAAASLDGNAEGKKKRRRNRGRKKKSKSGTTSAPSGRTGSPIPPKSAEHLPIPGRAHPPRPTSAPPPPTKPLPTDPLGQLEALSEKFQTTLKPMCEEFISNPPIDKAKREFEHKKLTETLLQQVLLKLDSVETAGVEGARERRKALVKECQRWLSKLDEVIR